MTRTKVESPVDADRTDPETTPPDVEPAPSGGAPMHWPDFWEELADDWARVKAVLAEEVPADAPAA